MSESNTENQNDSHKFEVMHEKYAKTISLPIFKTHSTPYETPNFIYYVIQPATRATNSQNCKKKQET